MCGVGGRLRRLNLHYLERRRVRGELMEVYKWMKGYTKGNINKVLVVRERSVSMRVCLCVGVEVCECKSVNVKSL